MVWNVNRFVCSFTFSVSCERWGCGYRAVKDAVVKVEDAVSQPIGGYYFIVKNI